MPWPSLFGLGLVSSIYVLFYCILRAGGYCADSQYHRPVVNRAKPLGSFYRDAAAEREPVTLNYSSDNLEMDRSETSERPILVHRGFFL